LVSKRAVPQRTISEQVEMINMQEKVSVVVTTKNEEKNIANCLKSIKLQTWSNVEIIVVDNNSSDKTKEIAREYTDLVFDKGPERSAQRNYGLIEIATGKYGMFIDADMILSPNILEACVGKIESDNLIALHIEEIVLGNGILAKARRFERSFYSGTCIDGVRFFGLEDFKAINGFDAALPPGPEDWDLDLRFLEIGKLGLVSIGAISEWVMSSFISSKGVWLTPGFAGIFHNEDEQTLRVYLSKKAYYSGSMDAYKRKWSGSPVVRKQLGIRYRYLSVFVENGRWKKLMRHPLLSVWMYVLRFFVGARYLFASRSRHK
jgi:glycosyltransferase involved in cell wall biosynthesis